MYDLIFSVPVILVLIVSMHLLMPCQSHGHMLTCQGGGEGESQREGDEEGAHRTLIEMKAAKVDAQLVVSNSSAL